MYLANQPFQDMFPTLGVEHLIKYGSIQGPLVLSCEVDIIQVKKLFNFLNFWIKHDTFLRVIKEHWKTNSMGNPFILFQD